MTAKIRLDELVVARGLAESKTKAQAMIMAGTVMHDTRVLDKPGHKYPDDFEISLKEPAHPWVSRGGMKLAHALDEFNISVEGAVAIDVGASTGGFTDVLLHQGAAKVYAVDVGKGELHQKLAADSRVIVLNSTNIRNVTAAEIPEAVDLVVCDVSFISLKKALPAALALTREDATVIALIKPQFEAGREHVERGGVVKDAAVHQQVCDDVTDWLNGQPGWQVQSVCESPITGAKSGNTEFLVWAIKGSS